ncbi:YggT family protein [Erythrobacter sp. KY5]|uniref:YggT family protein n=1 Tax=Erythrobacter sp. KY5 TaxID=2011159 RepID=UPI000DBEFBFB|nr:YggT family protein [Erythrobacter sp. KY5]AWW73508.1 YggT family protein [Erythrobacter sp. KY5]
MQGLFALYEIIELLVQVFVMLIIVQFVIGLLFAFNVVNQGNDFLRQVYESINRLLDPVLRPIRNIMPQTGALDLSPLVVIVGAQIVLIVLRSIISSVA